MFAVLLGYFLLCQRIFRAVHLFSNSHAESKSEGRDCVLFIRKNRQFQYPAAAASPSRPRDPCARMQPTYDDFYSNQRTDSSSLIFFVSSFRVRARSCLIRHSLFLTHSLSTIRLLNHVRCTNCVAGQRDCLLGLT